MEKTTSSRILQVINIQRRVSIEALFFLFLEAMISRHPAIITHPIMEKKGKGDGRNDTIYDFITDHSDVNGDHGSCGECHRSGGDRIIWRCDRVYFLDSMVDEKTYQEKEIRASALIFRDKYILLYEKQKQF